MGWLAVPICAFSGTKLASSRIDYSNDYPWLLLLLQSCYGPGRLLPDLRISPIAAAGLFAFEIDLAPNDQLC